MSPPIHITGRADADALLSNEPLALLIGMLLDQQIPLEWAFAGPATLRERLGHLDLDRIAAMPIDDLVAVSCLKPAIHRFPAAMARRIHALCGVLLEHYPAGAGAVWHTAPDAAALYRRLAALPGFGDEKCRILIALLAKRLGVRPSGWEEQAGVFADDQPRTIADCADAASLAAVRAWKKEQKAAGLDKQDRPTAPARS